MLVGTVLSALISVLCAFSPVTSAASASLGANAPDRISSTAPSVRTSRWTPGPLLTPVLSSAVVDLSPPPATGTSTSTSVATSIDAGTSASQGDPSALEPPGITFPGLGNTAGRVPPDPDVAASSSYVFEIAEPDFQIFSTTGTPLTGPTLSAALWAPLGGACADQSTGDWSQVIYDQFADRWVYSRSVHPSVGGATQSVQCLAVSETPDPTGAYYLYALEISNHYPTDYPQFGVWTNSYTVSTNLWTESGGSGTFKGDLIVAFDRAEMLAGEAVQTEMVTLGSAYESYVPVTLEGPNAPPSGTPQFLIGGPSDFSTSGTHLTAFAGLVNWATPSQSTVSGPYEIPVTPYQSKVCSASGDACAPQPGTSTKLQAWTDNLMDPVVYENLGSYQSIVGTFEVASSTHVDAMQWFEIRNPGPDATVYQQGVYQPDGLSRYDQSIGIDSAGDIALAYQISSATVYPSLAYVGRTTTDPLGSLPQPEQDLWTGSASQTPSTPGLDGASASRWGDASYLALSPDGCTFWYAGAYYPSSTSVWQTTIGSFQFSDCQPSSAQPSSISVGSAG